jgi:4-amino-4-deoxychorismate lyase
LYKCRLVYDNTMCQVTFTPYSIKPVTRLKIIYSNAIEYAHKYEDRTSLTEAFAQRGDCDDIIIIKNDFITDSYYANLILLDGSTWYTPSQPLLKGTYRQYLLDHGKIKEAAIHVEDVLAFSHIRLINALLRFDGPELSVTQIVF